MAKKKSKKKLIKGLWTKSELSLLKKLFPNNPTAKIAAKLKRPTDAVKKKASRMGLRKGRGTGTSKGGGTGLRKGRGTGPRKGRGTGPRKGRGTGPRAR